MKTWARCAAILAATSFLFWAENASAVQQMEVHVRPLGVPSRGGKVESAPELSRTGAAAAASLLLGGAALLLVRPRNRVRIG